MKTYLITDEQLQTIRSLLNDIEVMRASINSEENVVSLDSPHFFGGFPNGFEDDGNLTYIEWPNLSLQARTIATILGGEAVPEQAERADDG